MATEKLSAAKRIEPFQDNVWEQFGQLAADCNATNLGKGFPDSFPPKHVQEALAEAAKSVSPLQYQYTRPLGHPRLVKAIAKLYSPVLGRQINAYEEILISVGAFGALQCAVMGLINPGDEAIIIEPFFDCYQPMVIAAGGIPVFIPLRPTKSSVSSSADFKLDPEELASKFNSKTKAIFFNTPNNPLGKVFTQEETEMVADLCKKHDVIVFSDEVYEWIVYPPNKHVKIVTLPGMWERTLSIGSAGKTFSATGWKTGWTIGPKHLVNACQTMHQNCIYNCPTPIQEALGISFETEIARLGQPDSYFTSLAQELLPKRDVLADLLRKAGMEPIVPEGGYFMMADYTKLAAECEDGTDDPEDYKFVRWMTKQKKLAAIPPSAFYSKEHKHLGEKYVRFCFIKEESTLEKAAKIFENWN